MKFILAFVIGFTLVWAAQAGDGDPFAPLEKHTSYIDPLLVSQLQALEERVANLELRLQRLEK